MTQAKTGLCECGCGQPAPIASGSNARRGWVKGQPLRFIRFHGSSVRVSKGYRERGGNGRKREHVTVVECALGHPLPTGAEVHHVNGDKSDNRNCNLVACQDHAYHSLLHCRERALVACGNPSWRQCKYCKTYDAPTNLESVVLGSQPYHFACKQDFDRKRRAIAAAAAGKPAPKPRHRRRNAELAK